MSVSPMVVKANSWGMVRLAAAATVAVGILSHVASAILADVKPGFQPGGRNLTKVKP